MKKPILFFISFLILFTSCRKYKDGGLVANSKSRIARSWMLENYTVNGIDSTEAKMSLGFDRTVITFFEGSDIGGYTRPRNAIEVGTTSNLDLYGSNDGKCGYRCFEDYWKIDKTARELELLKGNCFFS